MKHYTYNTNRYLDYIKKYDSFLMQERLQAEMQLRNSLNQLQNHSLNQLLDHLSKQAEDQFKALQNQNTGLIGLGGIFGL